MKESADNIRVVLDLAKKIILDRHMSFKLKKEYI